jgi:quinol monooxygenase YgiN
MSDTQLPARSVLFLQVKPGMRDALVEVFRRIDIPGHALQQQGCLSVEVQVPPGPDGPVLVTALWSHRAAYDGWLTNPWREYSGNEIAPFLDGESTGVVYDIVLAGGDTSAVAAGAPKAPTRES